MKLTPDEVAKIATLARLRLTDAETEKFRDQLSDVLTYMEQLGQVDTSHVSATAQVTGQQNVLADDVVQVFPEREQLLGLAPCIEKGYIKVPAVFEGQK